jgi:hypothetical protein
VHAPTEDKTDDTKDNLSEEAESTFNQFLKFHTKILLRDFNAKVTEGIFKTTVTNTNLHEISTDNGV